MLMMRSCPKCNGAVTRDRDCYGWYEQCIQCGYLRDIQSAAISHIQPPRRAKNAVLASYQQAIAPVTKVPESAIVMSSHGSA